MNMEKNHRILGAKTLYVGTKRGLFLGIVRGTRRAVVDLIKRVEILTLSDVFSSVWINVDLFI